MADGTERHTSLRDLLIFTVVAIAFAGLVLAIGTWVIDEPNEIAHTAHISN